MTELAEKITDSELEVMHTLWDAPEALPIAAIRRALQLRRGWESTTIKTLVQRLCAKGAVNQERREVFYYSAAISEQDYNSWATGDLIRKLYRGSARDLAAALVHAEALTEEDIDELRAMFRAGGEK